MSEYVFETPGITLRIAVKRPLSNIMAQNACVEFNFDRTSVLLSIKLDEDTLLYVPMSNIICMIVETED